MSEEEKTPDTSRGGKSEGEDSNNRTPDTSRGGKSEGEDSKEMKRCCARCRNHETDLIKLKGHKNFCPWRDCYCELCLKTVFRQKLMADQTATRRKRQEMERRERDGLPLVVPSAITSKRLKTSKPCIISPEQPSIVSFSPPTSQKYNQCGNQTALSSYSEMCIDTQDFLRMAVT